MIADGARRRRADQRGETTDESHARLDDERIVAAVTDAASRGRIPESHDPETTTCVKRPTYVGTVRMYVRGGSQALRVIRSLGLVPPRHSMLMVRENKMASTIAVAEKKSVDAARHAFTNDSAFMIAYERAIETEKKGSDGDSSEVCLVDDPFARMLAGNKGKELSDSFGISAAPQFGLWPDFHKQWTVVRTKFIDDHIARIVNEFEASAICGEQLQFLNLGAGLDTRSLRLKAMAKITASYEVDMEAINGPKGDLFEAIGAGSEHPFLCQRNIVTANMTNDGELEASLVESGFDRERATIVLAEGLIMYLGDKAETFLKDVSRIVVASGSWLILNFIEHPALTNEKVRELLMRGGWKDLVFNCFGDEVLDYGRFDKSYEPSKAFSFVVCRKD